MYPLRMAVKKTFERECEHGCPKQLFYPKKAIFNGLEWRIWIPKFEKKIKYRSCEKKPPLFYILGGHGGHFTPYSYCGVRLCLLQPLQMPIWAKCTRLSRERRANLAQFSRTGMHIFTMTKPVLVAINRPNVLCSLFALFAVSEALTKGMYILEVTKGPLAGPLSQLLYGQRALPTHGPLCDVPPVLTEAIVYGVVVNDNPHT